MENLKKANKIYDMYRGTNNQIKMNEVSISKESGIPQPIISKTVKTFGQYHYGNSIENEGFKKIMVKESDFKFLNNYDIDLRGYIMQPYYGMK